MHCSHLSSSRLTCDARAALAHTAIGALVDADIDIERRQARLRTLRCSDVVGRQVGGAFVVDNNGVDDVPWPMLLSADCYALAGNLRDRFSVVVDFFLT